MIDVQYYNKKAFIYLKVNSSDKLIVMFQTHNGGNTFFRVKSFKDNLKYNVLFINDPQNTYYLEDDNGKKYSEFLDNFISQYESHNVIFCGSSMGGYGALYHGISMGVNILASNPQIQKEETLKYDIAEKGNLYATISNISFINITDLMAKHHDSCIWYIHGTNKLDIGNLHVFLNSSTHENQIIEQIDNAEHIYYLFDIIDLYDRIDILLKFRKLTHSIAK